MCFRVDFLCGKKHRRREDRGKKKQKKNERERERVFWILPPSPCLPPPDQFFFFSPHISESLNKRAVDFLDKERKERPSILCLFFRCDASERVIKVAVGRVRLPPFSSFVLSERLFFFFLCGRERFSSLLFFSRGHQLVHNAAFEPLSLSLSLSLCSTHGERERERETKGEKVVSNNKK